MEQMQRGPPSKHLSHNPEQNDISERVKLTLMNDVRAALYTEKMSDEYWPYKIQDVAAKKVPIGELSNQCLPNTQLYKEHNRNPATAYIRTNRTHP